MKADLSDRLSQHFQRGRIVLDQRHVVAVLGALGQRRHHGVGFLQEAAVLPVSGFVSDELLRKRFGDVTSFSRATTRGRYVSAVCHLEDDFVLLNPLQGLL